MVCLAAPPGQHADGPLPLFFVDGVPVEALSDDTADVQTRGRPQCPCGDQAHQGCPLLPVADDDLGTAGRVHQQLRRSAVADSPGRAVEVGELHSQRVVHPLAESVDELGRADVFPPFGGVEDESLVSRRLDEDDVAGNAHPISFLFPRSRT